jgi:murein DD-endopeptidase MepM/ murein hydrolase activator NlpD
VNTRVAFILFAAMVAVIPGAVHAQTNIALGQNAWTDCRSYVDPNNPSAYYGPQNALDGNVDTKWVTDGFQSRCYIYFSVGNRSISQVTVKHATSGISDTWPQMNTPAYEVWYLDASGWHLAESVDNSALNEVTTSYVNFTATFVKIQITNPSAIDYYARIPEIEVYQWGDSNPDPGTGRIGWPFSGHKDNRGPWVQVTGSSLHTGDDQYAEDWVGGSSTCGAPFYAPIAGKVIYAGYTGAGTGFASYGYQIVIRSTINRFYAFRVAHLQAGSITKVKGDYVRVGELIGRVGNTPNWSTCHAHMVVYKNINAVSSLNGLNGVDNLKAGSSPSGAITPAASPFAAPFNPNAPGRIANP